MEIRRPTLGNLMSAAASLLALCAVGCQSDPAGDEDAGVMMPRDMEPADDAGAGDAGGGGIRLRLELTDDVAGDVFIQLSDVVDQPGWVRLSHDGQRYPFTVPCGTECGTPGFQCGAAIPIVLQLADDALTATYETEWDGRVALRDAENDCSTQGPAPEGDWIATFCWGTSYTPQGEPLGDGRLPGEIQGEICTDVAFQLPGATEVVAQLGGG